MTLEQYIETFENPEVWFKDEVNRPYHKKRIGNVIFSVTFKIGIKFSTRCP